MGNLPLIFLLYNIYRRIRHILLPVISTEIPFDPYITRCSSPIEGDHESQMVFRVGKGDENEENWEGLGIPACLQRCLRQMLVKKREPRFGAQPTWGKILRSMEHRRV